ncbi:MAG: bacillithiol biosynthesis deacetylase BshB1 [Planctomycetes bacterium]|nr:bacillithiol biosynthesis deacetylase BshB1 [Planctomycetota bacterium]
MSKTILAVGPHPDDVEGGIGGTIIKLSRMGYAVHIVDLTNGEPTPHGSPAIRKKEWEKSSEILGIESRTVLDLPNRYLMDSVEARIKLAEVIRLKRPDVMFVPYWEDAHPDHIQATKIAEAARFYAKLTKTDMAGEPWYPSKLFYYICSHLRVYMDPAFILDVSDVHKEKMIACKTYGSQFAYDEQRWKFISGLINAYGLYYGQLIRAEYGEPFAAKENLALSDIRDIL